MKNALRVILFSIALFSFNGVFAQSGCPDIDAGSDITLPCGTNCTNITANYFQTGNTATYSVNSVPYTPFPFNQGTSILVNQDDVWSTVIDLPFTFCFFDQAYTQAVVGANGIITFDVTEANQTCDWDIRTVGTLPTTNTYTNSIMGPYHDIDPSLGGNLRYDIIGTAPCRIFVVSYSNIPMYNSDDNSSNCSSTVDATHQIALYETTNAIEVYIKDKDACTDWNNGLAIEGIQNASGTVAYTVPGRNNTVWSAQNDAYRFTPNGTSIVSVEWLQGATQVATGATFQACVNQPTTYTAKATYLPCSGGTPIVVTDDVVVAPGGSLIAGVDSTKNIGCNSTSGGAAYASVTGGVAPVNYGWADGNTNLIRTGLAAGTYVFTASDGSGCVISDTVVITQVPPISVSVADVTQSACVGTNTPLVAVVAGGSYPFTFSWNSNPVQTDSILDGVAAGTYSVTVTDAGGCTATDNGTLTIQTGGVTINAPTIVNVSCAGSGNGSITASASGTGPLTYSWSNQQTGATISSLPAGSYTLTVSDASGCSSTATYQITEPAPIVIGQPAITQATCQAGGSITVTATGGNGTLTYTWSNTQTGTSITGLAGGPYVLTVTDLSSCSVSASFVVPVAQGVVTFDNPAISDVTCNGDTNGVITASASGGSGVITFAWSTGGNTASVGPLAPGAYSVTITDEVNCSASTTYIIAEPSVINPNFTFSQLICFGASNGTASVAPTGGVPGYTYVWSTGSQSSSLSNLPAGIVLVTVTDNNQCSATASGIIIQADQIWYTSILDLHLCDGNAYGNLNITTTGGIGTLTFDVPDVGNNTTGVFANIPSGNYTFTVTDSLGCSNSGTFIIPQSAANDNFTVLVDSVSCFGSSDGVVYVTPLSAHGPYSYSVNGSSFGGDSIFTGLAAGTYTIITQNNYGCLDTLTAVVGSPDQLLVNASPDTIITAPGADNPITVLAQNFDNPAYTWTPEAGLSCNNCNNPTANVETATVFYVTVSEGENQNCSASDSVVVIVGGGFVMPNAFTPNGDGKNDRYGPVSFGASTLKEFRIYNRWGELVHNSLDSWNGSLSGKDQPAGTFVYYIQIESPDANGGKKTEKKQGSFSLIR